mmetsp:Transcript_74983/g.223448  ORF Transcript_74983/g.223448 Transcript_74983/m.223448 type:complete len:583 (-) Transcript_74983:90-1838(-)
MGVLHAILLCDLSLHFGLAANVADHVADRDDSPLLRRLSADLPLLAALQVWFSSGGSASIPWDHYTPKYSLTVPTEAVAIALVAYLDATHGSTELALHKPEDGHREVLVPGVPSSYVDVPTEEATALLLELRSGSHVSNYTISIVRSTITANLQLGYSDAAKHVLPQGTLTGLSVLDSAGAPVHVTPPAFVPQQTQYLVSVGLTAAWIWVLASSNDPEGGLSIRTNGDSWRPLEAGRSSAVIAVPERGWLLVEVRVESPASMVAGHPPLVYELLLTRDSTCHERCSSCNGPGEGHCLTCRPPLLLSRGHCVSSRCPADGFYGGRSARCEHCHASCAQCAGAGVDECTLCPALRFLSPRAWAERTGPCVAKCPDGYFAHPQSRRCRRPPAVPIKAFYMRFLFRLRFAVFHEDSQLRESVHNATAFVLGLSLSDVRLHAVEQSRGMLQAMLEVVSPFLSKSEADRVLIDSWFGAFEAPVDAVSSLSWDEVHPPPPPEVVKPLIALWMWGLMASGAASVAICFLSYCFYFRRLKNIKSKYSARKGVDEKFIDRVANQSPAWLVSRFIALESGAKHHHTRARLKNR